MTRIAVPEGFRAAQKLLAAAGSGGAGGCAPAEERQAH
jgi:hypothetical protein